MTDYIERERALAMLHKDEFGTPDERWHPESEIAEAILRVPAADARDDAEHPAANRMNLSGFLTGCGTGKVEE